MRAEQPDEGFEEGSELVSLHVWDFVVVEQALAEQRVCSLLAGVGFEHSVHANAFPRGPEQSQQRHRESTDE
jgi:hypothetical protein